MGELLDYATPQPAKLPLRTEYRIVAGIAALMSLAGLILNLGDLDAVLLMTASAVFWFWITLLGIFPRRHRR